MILSVPIPVKAQASPGNSTPSPKTPKIIENQILVQFTEVPWQMPEGQSSAKFSAVTEILPLLQGFLSPKNIASVSKLSETERLAAMAVAKYDATKAKILVNNIHTLLSNRYLLTLKNPKEREWIKNQLLQSDKVRKVADNEILATETSPNDPDYTLQWGLPFVGAEGVWDIMTDASPILVGITDGGFQEDHVDLTDNVALARDSVDGDDDPTSELNACDTHGNMVAGVIGARGNNASGTSVIFWNGSLALYRKGTDESDGGCNTTSAQSETTLIAALADRVDIINNSFTLSSWLEAYVAADPYVLFVNSAGNSSNDDDSDSTALNMAGYENFLQVANAESSGAMRYTSDYGNATVHLAAPGTDIYSTSLDNGYDTDTGTSLAAPMVSGAAALTWAVCPTLLATDVRNILMSTVTRDDANWEFYTVSHGILNVHDAVFSAIGRCLTVSPHHLPTAVAPGNSFAFDFDFTNTSAFTDFTAEILLQKTALGTEPTSSSMSGQDSSQSIAKQVVFSSARTHFSLIPDEGNCDQNRDCEVIGEEDFSQAISSTEEVSHSIQATVPANRVTGNYFIQLRILDKNSRSIFKKTSPYIGSFGFGAMQPIFFEPVLKVE